MDEDWVRLVAVLDSVSERVAMFGPARERSIRPKPEALGAGSTWLSSGELGRFLRIWVNKTTGSGDVTGGEGDMTGREGTAAGRMGETTGGAGVATGFSRTRSFLFF